MRLSTKRFNRSSAAAIFSVVVNALPILTATTNEIVHEVKSDLPKVLISDAIASGWIAVLFDARTNGKVAPKAASRPRRRHEQRDGARRGAALM